MIFVPTWDENKVRKVSISHLLCNRCELHKYMFLFKLCVNRKALRQHLHIRVLLCIINAHQDYANSSSIVTGSNRMQVILSKEKIKPLSLLQWNNSKEETKRLEWTFQCAANSQNVNIITKY